MADAIKLSVTGDTQALVDAVKKGAVAVEDLQDVLKDAGKQGDRSGDEITKGMAGSQRDTKELKAEIKKATDEFEKAGRAGRDFGDNVYKGADTARDGFKRAEEGVEEFKGEANSTAKEVAASFDGSADSIAGGFQEVAANAFGGFGPAGVAAGLVAAGGIGVVLTEITAQQEAVDALKQKFADAYQAAAEEGRNYLDQAQVQSDVLDLLFNPDRAGEWKQVQEDAKTLGVDALDLAYANAGEQDKLNGLLDLTNQKRDDAIAKGKEEGGAIYEQLGPLGDVQRRLEDHKAIQDDNIARANTLIDYTGKQGEKQRDANAATRDQGAAVDEVAGKVRNAARVIPVTVDFTGAEAAISAFTRRERAAIQIGASVVGPTGKRVIP